MSEQPIDTQADPYNDASREMTRRVMEEAVSLRKQHRTAESALEQKLSSEEENKKTYELGDELAEIWEKTESIRPQLGSMLLHEMHHAGFRVTSDMYGKSGNNEEDRKKAKTALGDCMLVTLQEAMRAQARAARKAESDRKLAADDSDRALSASTTHYRENQDIYQDAAVEGAASHGVEVSFGKNPELETK